MKRLTSLFLTFVLIITTLGVTGCSPNDKYEDLKIYSLDRLYTSLHASSFKEKGTEEELLVKMIEQLKVDPSDVDQFSAIPSDVKILKTNLDTETGVLYIVFDKNYLEYKDNKEILSRAAIVLTLTQLDIVKYVEFFVEDEPLKDKSGHEVGRMSEESFAEVLSDTMLASRTKSDFTLYFANEDYSALKPYKFQGTYLTDTSLEEYIIKELINGPSDDSYCRTLSRDTKLISAVTTDGICYVNFDSDFESVNVGYKTDIIIYSIVNSLSELPYITLVRISINGNTTNTFNGMSLDTNFSKNLDMVEGTDK